MTLVWLGFALIAIVAGFAFLIWDVGYQSRKQQRVLEIAAERGRRTNEDRCWATSRQAEYQHAKSISLTRANLVAAEDLIEALTPTDPRVDVVA